MTSARDSLAGHIKKAPLRCLEFLRGIPESVLAMRLAGFSAAIIITAILDIFFHFSYVYTPYLAMLLAYLLLTTILFADPAGRRSEAGLLTLFLLDTLIISSLIYFSRTAPNVLAPLYLIVLISASLLSRKMFFTVGAIGLAAYGTVVYLDYSSDYLNREQATEIALVALVTGIVAGLSLYSAYILKERRKQDLKLKDRFVFMTAHDLRAPFALIRLMAEKYSNDASIDKAELKEDMASVEENIVAATQLLDDLLLLARGEELEPKIEPVDMPSLVSEVLSHWKFAASKKNISIFYEPTSRIPLTMCDRRRAGYVLENILSNSIKYNVPNGRVRIWHELKGHFLETAVEDSGRGIAQENIDKIFDPYFREDAEGNIPGTGLGLYSAKRFMKRMKGDIVANSGKWGSRFTIILPLAGEQSQE